MSPKQRFNITLEEHQIALLREIEQVNGLSASAQIRLAIEQWVQSRQKVAQALEAERRLLKPLRESKQTRSTKAGKKR